MLEKMTNSEKSFCSDSLIRSALHFDDPSQATHFRSFQFSVCVDPEVVRRCLFGQVAEQFPQARWAARNEFSNLPVQERAVSVMEYDLERGHRGAAMFSSSKSSLMMFADLRTRKDGMNLFRKDSQRSAGSSMRRLATGLCALVLILQAVPAESSEPADHEPGWIPIVVARGSLREQIDATPIELRPYRPLHFYGNTVRRRYYRGTSMPRPREVLALPARIIVPRSQARFAETYPEKIAH